MVKRFITSLLLVALIALITIVTWNALRNHQHSQIAQIAESQSYAARSKLIRDIDTMFRTLRGIREYWSRYGHLPREEWATDPGNEIEQLQGIEFLLWTDPARGIRYVRSDVHPTFDYRPTVQEWPVYERLNSRALEVTGEMILGPWIDQNGRVTYEIYISSSMPGQSGTLAAVVDAQKSFEGLLLDESPGYAISIFQDDVLLYQRGEASGGYPESWTREGMIRTSPGILWRVVHSPTTALAESFETPALKAILGAGLAIAVLVGLLWFENGRAKSRAQAAEAAEEKLADLNRDLERQIAERVKELAIRSTDLETITDSVAHDLRNPLNSISVNTQLLQQQFHDVLRDEGLDALQRTTSGVKRMTEILDRLLGLSVVSHSIFNRQEMDIAEVLTDVFEELVATEQPPRVEMIMADLPRANADATLVRTLVMNLLSNAIKYTRDKPQRRIEVSAVADDGVMAYCVRDNGIGFDQASEERLFRAFERLEGNGEADGVGLGLDIAARAVRRHGGRIWAKGKPGEGAAFYFTLEPDEAP